MKKVEFVQSAYNGGFPAPSGNGFTHGEGVYVVSKRDLDAFENRAANFEKTLRGLIEICKVEQMNEAELDATLEVATKLLNERA